MLPDWIKNYRSSDFKPDLIAGLTVGVLLIPQGMAYAMLAGLPPVFGLYASTIPLIVYGLLGTSRQLSVGPVAIDSMLTAAGVGLIAQAGSGAYIELAITLALMVGLIQFSLGVSKLGFLINFLSHPVIQGFTSAAAIIIAFSQLKHLLGIDMPSSQHLHHAIHAIFEGLNDIHPLTLFIGLGGILSLVTLRHFFPLFPGPLFLVIITTFVVGFWRLDILGVKVIGAIQKGLPSPGLPYLEYTTLKQLLPTAFAIALVSFMESMAVSRILQKKHKDYKVNTNKELLSIGMANMVGSLFRSFPVSGGFSRSAVNDQAGARTGLSSIVSALLIILTLLFMTPLFYYLPNAILASIIMVAIFKLIHLAEAKTLWQIDRKDFVMMSVTFLGTLFLGIGPGIGIGVLLSLAWIIFETSYPHHAELGRVPGTHSFRNVRRFKELLVHDDVLIFRFDAPLFFANVDRFREILMEYINARKTTLKAIIIDMESINTIDTSALNVFADTVEEINQANILFLLAEVKGPVRDKFHLSGLTRKLGEKNFFVTIEDALEFASGISKEDAFKIALQTNK